MANCGVIKYVVLALQVLVLRGEQLIQLFSENRYKCFISNVRQTSLIPRPSIPPVFDCLLHTKMEREGLAIVIT